MPTYISMLRGVNVGGQKPIRMAWLKSLYEELGFRNVTTYIQSGNVVFASPAASAPQLTGQIEAALEQSLGYAVKVLVRTPADLRRVLTSNPFLNGRSEDPARLAVLFLERTPARRRVGALSRPARERSEFVVRGKEVFLFCPEGFARTKLTNGFFESRLGQPATARNWNTVKALYSLAGGPEPDKRTPFLGGR